MKKIRQPARMRFADGTLSVQYVGHHAARSEHRDQIALTKVAILHENTEGVERLSVSEMSVCATTGQLEWHHCLPIVIVDAPVRL